jgi:hypothetical protein
VRKILFLVFCFCFYTSSYGQISYRTRYKTAVYAEVFALSPFTSLNLEHSVNRQMKSFTSIRYGLGYLPGSILDGGAGVSVPMSISQNILVNNLKRRIKHRVSLKCNSMPSRISVEWFGEGGLGYTPSFYPKSTRHRIWGMIGLRQQVVFDIPPKPRVLYLRIQFTPQYFQKKLIWNPVNSNGDGNVFGTGVGFSI